MEQNNINNNQVTSSDKADKWLAPVNRTALSITAGYLGLFAILIIPAPFALAIGIWALIDLKKRPNTWGKGRAWFGVIMGGLGTLALLAIIVATIIAASHKK